MRKTTPDARNEPAYTHAVYLYDIVRTRATYWVGSPGTPGIVDGTQDAQTTKPEFTYYMHHPVRTKADLGRDPVHLTVWCVDTRG